MPTMFIGLLALALVLWLLKSFARADPQYLIKVGRTAGGIVALAGRCVHGGARPIGVALPLGVTGLGLLGWLPRGALGFWPGGREEPRPDFAGAFEFSRGRPSITTAAR